MGSQLESMERAALVCDGLFACYRLEVSPPWYLYRCLPLASHGTVYRWHRCAKNRRKKASTQYVGLCCTVRFACSKARIVFCALIRHLVLLGSVLLLCLEAVLLRCTENWPQGQRLGASLVRIDDHLVHNWGGGSDVWTFLLHSFIGL